MDAPTNESTIGRRPRRLNSGGMAICRMPKAQVAVGKIESCRSGNGQQNPAATLDFAGYCILTTVGFPFGRWVRHQTCTPLIHFSFSSFSFLCGPSFLERCLSGSIF